MIALPLLLTALAAEPADEAPAKTLYRPDAFATLVDPDCSHCNIEAKRAAGALRDDDRVLAWVRGDYGGGAIPYRWFLVPNRVISDTYGVFVYDPDADFVRAWPASLDFRFHGWRNGVMVMSRKDGTIFDCLTGAAVEGPGAAKGERLEPVPAIETDWGPWLGRNPGTVAYEMVAKFRPSPIPTAVGDESRRTRPEFRDTRLGPEARVFALAVDGASRAWPLERFGRRPEILVEKVGDRPVVLLWDGATRTAAAFAPETEGKESRKVTLRRAGETEPAAPWVDRETGSRWSIEGRAVAGPLKGQALRWLPGVMVKWYAWLGAYPRTELASPRP
jgi:hypothetical protein